VRFVGDDLVEQPLGHPQSRPEPNQDPDGQKLGELRPAPTESAVGRCIQEVD
jgi:hypothetical protein